MLKYFHSYADKKPAILLMCKDSIPPGMAIGDIADLFDRSEPVPYVGEHAPSLVETKEYFDKLSLLNDSRKVD